MIADSPELTGFRAAVRAWLGEHVPYSWRTWLAGAGPEEQLEFQRWWLGELRGAGYAAPAWPAEHGGASATLGQQVVLEQEMLRAAAPELPMFFVALNQVGATLIAHGTPDQQRHLGAILGGEVWCQGFSEPDAGSDLASLSTTALRREGRYVVNGQKVWSSYAQYAQWCLLLVRTDPAQPGPRGLSLLLLDMDTPGVEVRPIRQLTGEREFCELFLTDVEVPLDGLVGQEGQGWLIAQTGLTAERGPVMLTLAERVRTQYDQLVSLAVATGAAEDPSVRQMLGRTAAEVDVLRSLAERLVAGLLTGEGSPADASITKVFFSELVQRLTDEAVELQGLGAFVAAQPKALDFHATGVWLMDHLASWRWTIAAGTNQIQRNLIGERGLGLPREPAVAR